MRTNFDQGKRGWRLVAQPLQMCLRKGWSWGRRSLISPRGTVFEVRPTSLGLVARQRREFQLETER